MKKKQKRVLFMKHRIYDAFDVSLELRLQVQHCTTKTLWSQAYNIVKVYVFKLSLKLIVWSWRLNE